MTTGPSSGPTLPPHLPTLRTGEVTVLAVPCEDPPFDPGMMRRWTSEAERARIDRFRMSADRTRALVGRGLARALLGHTLGIEPGEVQLREGQHGRPELCESPAPGIDFNVSHSGDWAIVGVTLGAAVGVDVEQVRPVADLDSLMGSVLRPSEARVLARLDDRDRLDRFLCCWTLKEASLKARGTGLGGGLASVELEVPERMGEPVALVAIGPGSGGAEGWTSWTGEPAAGYRVAVVTDQGEARFHSFRWEGAPGWRPWPGVTSAP